MKVHTSSVVTINGFFLKKLYTICIVALPLLSIYKSIVSILDLGSFFIITLGILIFIKEQKILNLFRGRWQIWGCYLTYIVGITLITNIYVERYAPFSTAIMRLIKTFMYILLTLYTCKFGYFLSKYAIKIYEMIALLCTFFLCSQVLAYLLFSIDLAGYLPDYVYIEGYSIRASNLATGLFRPTSFFLEPAHYFEYVSMILVIYLFYSKNDKKAIYKASFITLGAILSTSGQGVIISLLIWLFWLLKSKKLAIKTAIFLVALSSTLILYFYFYKDSLALAIISRIGNISESKIVSGRSDGYFQIMNMPIEQLIFGRGFGNYKSVFIASWAGNILCYGLIGTLIVIFVYMNSLKFTKYKLIVYLNALMSVFSSTFFSYYFAFYFSFILNGDKNWKIPCEYSGKKFE